MKRWIDEYLEDRREAWSETTIKSERSRLNKVAPLLKLGSAEIFRQLTFAGRKPYAIKTTFVRLCDFEAWAIQKKYLLEPKFREYMERHKNKFKHAYQKEELGLTYEDARKRIMTLEEPYRSMARGMLKTGVRLSEAYKVKDGKVKGKGGKPRKVFGTIDKTCPKVTLWRKLKSVGLKPHSLRKLWATKLVDKGATPQDLCKAAGWSSINTAYSYLQPKDDERLGAFIQDATKE